MASSLVLVTGPIRIDLNDRIGLFLQAGYFPTVDVGAETITESVKVQLRGPWRENIGNLNRMFEKARKQDPTADKVYIEYKVNESEDAWRSRIWNGAVSMTSGLAQEAGRGRVNVEISFERDPFWEGPETPLPIGNANKSSPARIFNANDLAGMTPNRRINAAHVTANWIEGDLPTPVRLEISNLYSKTLSGLWIGMNNSRPSWNSGWMFEAESAIGITPVTAAGASGGAIAQGTLSYGSAQPILRWAVPESLVSMTRGQRLRMLLRPFYTGKYSVFKYKLRIVSGATTLFETDWVRPSQLYARHWLDLFDFRMPPWLEGMTGLAGLTLELWATPTRAGSWTWAFDDVMLFAQDGFVAVDTTTVVGGKVVIDGDHGWSEDAAGLKSGLRKMVGSLMLTPMAFHLFTFAMHANYADDAPIDFVVGVSGSYRPRRWSV